MFLFILCSDSDIYWGLFLKKRMEADHHHGDANATTVTLADHGSSTDNSRPKLQDRLMRLRSDWQLTRDSSRRTSMSSRAGNLGGLQMKLTNIFRFI